MSQSSDINWRPSCLVADSASDTLTRAQHASFFAAHWFGWWILLDVHLTSLYVCCYWQPAQRRRRRRRRGRTVASWDRNLTSLFFPPFLFLTRLSEKPRVCCRAQTHAPAVMHILPNQGFQGRKRGEQSKQHDGQFQEKYNFYHLQLCVACLLRFELVLFKAEFSWRCVFLKARKVSMNLITWEACNIIRWSSYINTKSINCFASEIKIETISSKGSQILNPSTEKCLCVNLAQKCLRLCCVFKCVRLPPDVYVHLMLKSLIAAVWYFYYGELCVLVCTLKFWMQNICVTYIVCYILPGLCCVLSCSYSCMCPLLHIVSFICVIFSNTLQLFWVGTSLYNLGVSACLPLCVFSTCKSPGFRLIFIFHACVRVCFPQFQCSCSCMSLFKRNCAWVCLKVCACFCVLVCVLVSGCVPTYYFVCCARMWVLCVRVHVQFCGMFERNFISSLFVCLSVLSYTVKRAHNAFISDITGYHAYCATDYYGVFFVLSQCALV